MVTFQQIFIMPRGFYLWYHELVNIGVGAMHKPVGTGNCFPQWKHDGYPQSPDVQLKEKGSRVASQTYVVQHVCPSLHGDALEDGEHGEQNVVELGDPVVGSNPPFPTVRAIGAQPGWRCSTTRPVICSLIWSQRERYSFTIK